MQVNPESRDVLAGRELQRVVDGDLYSITVTYENNLSSLDSSETFRKFFFANWDIDMFYWRNNLNTLMRKVLGDRSVQKMKRVAIYPLPPWHLTRTQILLWYYIRPTLQETVYYILLGGGTRAAITSVSHPPPPSIVDQTFSRALV